MRSALGNAAVVQEYLDKEVSLGRIIGPVSPEMMPIGTQISPFGRSVNSGIDAELCSLSYLHLDRVTDHIIKSGRGTELAKMDIASAYRIVPVHPGDRPLLAVQWAGKIYFDTRLPFGLRSAPKIFTAVADALQWIFQKQGVTCRGSKVKF